MERMNPPPSYYGSMYQGENYNQNFNENVPFPENENETITVANKTVSETNYDEGENLGNGINNVKIFFDDFKKQVDQNISKTVRVYATFTDSSKWHDKIFEGVLISSESDSLIIQDTSKKIYYVISKVYVNYLELIAL